MPVVSVGGHKMGWHEYWAMIAKMEKSQEPFKKLVAKKLLPRYEEFLKGNFSVGAARKHLKVADIFFQRAMHVGFIEFKEIRLDFIQKEFPQWWQTHVLQSNLSEKQILSSVGKLFEFLALFCEIDIKKFGFELKNLE